MLFTHQEVREKLLEVHGVECSLFGLTFAEIKIGFFDLALMLGTVELMPFPREQASFYTNRQVAALE
jgi:hypothetical protein